MCLEYSTPGRGNYESSLVIEIWCGDVIWSGSLMKDILGEEQGGPRVSRRGQAVVTSDLERDLPVVRVEKLRPRKGKGRACGRRRVM